MDKILTTLKAHTAAVLAVAFWLVAALHDGNISGPEWLGLPAALGIGGAVYAVPNKPKRQRTHGPAGYALPELLAAVVVVVIVVLLIVILAHHAR